MKNPSSSYETLEWKKMIIDYHRTIVFPNNIRKFRRQRNLGSLLELSEHIPEITYIRLSKIERGEIFARASELRELGRALDIAPLELLIDVDNPEFDIAAWAEPLHGAQPADAAKEREAVLLAAALRARRAGDPDLTIAVLERDYGIASVVLSRIENALKPLDRWKEDIRKALCRLFDVADETELRAHLETLHASGDLDAVLPLVANPETRLRKSRSRIAALRQELCETSPEDETGPAPGANRSRAATPLPSSEDQPRLRLLPVFGTPLADGLIAATPTGALIEAPRIAGPNAYGLRMGRATLGAGLPGRATLVVDPDRYPSPGGLAVVREDEALRVLSVTADRNGRMTGYSESPDVEVIIDTLDPANVATVLAAQFE